MKLMDARQLGRWIAEDEALWQMKLLDARELGSAARDRGVDFWDDHILQLWELRLLKADLIVSERRLRIHGLQPSGRDESGRYLYADGRTARPRKSGWANAARRNQDDLSRDLELRFHPFRYWVLYKLQYFLEHKPTPIQVLVSGRGFCSVSRWFLRHFKRRDMAGTAERVNDVVALAVASEPCAYSRIFGSVHYSADRSVEEQHRLIDEHRARMLPIYESIPVAAIEKARDELCRDAEVLDPNKSIYGMLRLARGKSRLEAKGHLGGSLYLRAIAEVLRRMAEDAHHVQLPEEDQKGFGHVIVESRKKIYGSARLFDGNRDVAREFMRQFQADYGARLRWYFEGETEEGALRHAFGEDTGSPITLVNLRGNVIRRNALAFRDALRNDIQNGVFSVITLDADRPDFVKTARTAAKDDEFCGELYIHEPDFEFGNFSVGELEEIVRQLALSQGIEETDLSTLHAAVRQSGSGKQFMRAACRAIPGLAKLGKGGAWGEALIRYALEHPEWPTGETRPIIKAITTAARATQYSYRVTRDQLRTAEPVNKNETAGS